MVEYLLDINPDLNIQQGFENACKNNKIKLIKYLLELNPELNIPEALKQHIII
jgi:hypothetical protein